VGEKEKTSAAGRLGKRKMDVRDQDKDGFCSGDPRCKGKSEDRFTKGRVKSLDYRRKGWTEH